jgi:hypothetical protein
MLRLLAAMIVMSFFVACSSAKFISTGKSYPAKSDDCEIEIFTSKLPDRGYEELGIIEGEVQNYPIVAMKNWASSKEKDLLEKIPLKMCYQK